MSVKQISIFVENQTGLLAEVTSALSDKGVNLRALSIADNTDFGILRIIVEKPEEAAAILKEAGYTYTVTQVLAVQIPDVAGGLSRVLQVLSENHIGLEYTYAFTSHKAGTACLIFRVEDNELAEKALADAGIRVSTLEEMF